MPRRKATGPLRERAEREAKQRADMAQAEEERAEAERNELRAARVAPTVAHLGKWCGTTDIAAADLKPYSNSRGVSVWDVDVDGFHLRVSANDHSSPVKITLEQVSDDGKDARYVERPWQLLEPWEKSHDAEPTNPGKGTT
jgi:hypothetical protein